MIRRRLCYGSDEPPGRPNGTANSPANLPANYSFVFRPGILRVYSRQCCTVR